jgi:hypothetical protein
MECVGCQKTERRLAFSGDKKPGNFYSDPLDRATWRRYDGETMDVGEVDQLFLCNGPSSGVTISVINGLLAALALGLASARLR